MTSPSDNLLERFQSDRSEYFSPPICEILREYEVWRSEASNDLVGEMEKALGDVRQMAVDEHWEPPVFCCRIIERIDEARSRMRDARNGESPPFGPGRMA